MHTAVSGVDVTRRRLGSNSASCLAIAAGEQGVALQFNCRTRMLNIDGTLVLTQPLKLWHANVRK